MERRPNRHIEAILALGEFLVDHIPTGQLSPISDHFQKPHDETRMFTREDHPQLWDGIEGYFTEQ